MRLFIVFVTFGQFSGKNDDGFGGQKNPECLFVFRFVPVPVRLLRQKFPPAAGCFPAPLWRQRFCSFAVAAEESAGIVGKVFRCGIAKRRPSFSARRAKRTPLLSQAASRVFSSSRGRASKRDDSVPVRPRRVQRPAGRPGRLAVRRLMTSV